jgi:hypothetical protein
LATGMRPALASSDTFWNVSDAFRDAADAAFDLTRADHYSGEVRIPCVFLYFRCIELALKSVLIYHGIPEPEITRALGHRVRALPAEAEKFPKFRAIGLSAEDRQLIDKFSDAYSDKWFEYPEDSLAAYPDLQTLRELATRLCAATQRYERPVAG